MRGLRQIMKTHTHTHAPTTIENILISTLYGRSE